MILLTSDWHLDDNPANDYRWDVFKHLSQWAEQSKDNNLIYHLGDLTDRKDRHSAALVNRMTTELKKLTDVGNTVQILMGNHDKPINGTPFWQFLSEMSDQLNFITSPQSMPRAKLALLPYADDPATAWDHIDFAQFKTVFMHQTVTGAKGNNGIVLENHKMFSFPAHLDVYSGDIHTTQTIKTRGAAAVRYIGAPHPVAFGDDYPSQMMELRDDYSFGSIIPITTIQKLMLRIDQPRDLERIAARVGDQARVVCKLAIEKVEQWPAMQDAISNWADQNGVTLFSVDPEIEGIHTANDDAEVPTLESDPAYILRLFADAEEIDDRMYEAGIALLKELG